MTRTATDAVLTESETRVLALLSEKRIVALASALIAAAGENPGGTEDATVAVLRAACDAHGIVTAETEVAPGRPNLVATLAGGAAPGLMFLGHSDVVPAGEGWSWDPFTPFRTGDRLFGRGSSDMKGGLAAIVLALAAIKEADVTLAGPATLFCTVDEEDLGLGIRALTAAATAAAGIGSFTACVVAEPTGLQTVIGCRGDAYIELTVQGKSAHSGRPSDGRNAISAASKIIALILADHARLQASQDDLLGAGSWNVGRIEGGDGTSMVAADCRVWIDRRLMPGENPHEIVAALAAQVTAAGIDGGGITVTFEVTMEMPGFRTSALDPVVAQAVAATAQAGGGESTIGGWSAACDGGFIDREFGVSTIVFGPGDLNRQAHQIDESVSVTELLVAARVYALLCLRLVGEVIV
ncbi:M20 family metallopeptidase [Cryobacterium ruanii]|uniref:Probable succinyl-diaminopimelate desuccinylase n=1 Tax=Cryobacterium ruanii TaxID=1259197 RepID=A0A4R9AMA2_9MICO|nr:ArgE/DapE family deacylase [Cryobacterium ruanii]TFD65333.1 M20 family peptidase [Cryobacterium ruanii]